jgi:hypothetical protein
MDVSVDRPDVVIYHKPGTPSKLGGLGGSEEDSSGEVTGIVAKSSSRETAPSDSEAAQPDLMASSGAAASYEPQVGVVSMDLGAPADSESHGGYSN